MTPDDGVKTRNESWCCLSERKIQLYKNVKIRSLTSQNFCWIQPQWQKLLCNPPLSVLWFHWVFYGGPNFSNMFDPVHFWPSLILSDLVWSGLILSDPVRFWPANLGIFGSNLWDPQKHREPQNLTIPLFSSLDHPEILIIITKLEFDCVISKVVDFSKTSQKVWILNKIISEYWWFFTRFYHVQTLYFPATFPQKSLNCIKLFEEVDSSK